ncbi:MAG: ATP-binding protein [Gammaproteobacteria bacterium]
MERAITSYIKQDLKKKLVLVTGPRQVGKTTLAKSLCTSYDYFNYDRAEDRLMVKETGWDRKKELVIFDELHKMHHWKRWLKGIYDTEGSTPSLLVTGSAKLNTYKKVGDSLAGRYFQYRLHPLDLKEARAQFSPEEAWKRLWSCSGFPEPFFAGSEIYYRRWRRSHVDVILRQDLVDLNNVRDIQAVETLVELLRKSVGSTVSYANLARDLEKDAKTVKRWLLMLEDLYVIFKVTPYNKKIARSLLKEPKYYFYDSAQIDHDDGAKLENLIATALLKELHLMEDLYGATTKLHFVRTKDGNEIDFLAMINGKPACLLESKWSDESPSKHFSHFANYFPQAKKIQLVKEIKREKTFLDGVEVRSVVDWLSNIDFSQYAN